MTHTNELLRQPSVDELLHVIQQAAKPTVRSPELWQPLLRMVAEHPHGVFPVHLTHEGLERHCFLLVAWWTNRQEQKLVRVVGNLTQDSNSIHASRYLGTEDPRPPVWHIQPESIYRVRSGNGEWRWLAACACGVVGIPEEIAWDGERCGPCHDRQEEGEPLPGAPWTLLPPRRSNTDIVDLAFSPTGDTLAVSRPPRELQAYSLTTGDARLLYRGSASDLGNREQLAPLVYSPDDTWLLAHDPHEHCLDVWKTEESVRVGLSFGVRGRSGSSCLAWSPFSNQFLAGVADQVLFLGRLQGSAWTLERIRDELQVYSAQYSPSGDEIALGLAQGQIALLDAATHQVLREYLIYVRHDEHTIFVHYLPEGRLLLLVGNPHYALIRPVRLILFDMDSGRVLRSTDSYLPSLIEVTPDGRYAALVAHDQTRSPAEVVFWDLREWHEAGAMEWNPDGILSALTLSPDGQTMATGSREGCVKLLPWRRLLQECAAEGLGSRGKPEA